MNRAPLPPGARDIIAKRERGYLLNDVYVASGWPSTRLKRHIAPPKYSVAYPCVLDSAHAVATPETARRYRWDWLVGLSVLLWAESPAQASILQAEAVPLIIVSQPLLVQLWRVYADHDGGIEFLKLSSDCEVRHAA